MTVFSSYASIVPETEPVKSWQDAVDDVKAGRAVASASDADFTTLDLIDDDYTVSTYASVGTVTNTVDYSGCAVQVNYDLNGKDVWDFVTLNSDGSFSKILPDGSKLKKLEFYLYRTALPSSGKYYFSFDLSSDFAIDWTKVYIAYSKSVNNASNFHSYYDPSFNKSSGDMYIPPFLLDLGSINRMAINLYLNEPFGDAVGGSVRFNFTQAYTSSDPVSSTPGVGAEFTQQDYQNGVTSGLSNIGDTLEEIVETISLQLEALWNQMYNYMHLPQYEKLEQIRQAIENIRLDVDVDNQDVVNKLDDQIQNDNVNTQRVEQAVEKHGNFIIEGLKSLFIPDEEYFSGLFDRLHQFFSDRLGFLYVPFDLLIRLLDAIKDADTAFAGIPFPGIRAGEWVLLEPMTVTFDILNEFPELVQALHFITSVVMISALLNLLHRKMEEVMSR